MKKKILAIGMGLTLTLSACTPELLESLLAVPGGDKTEETDSTSSSSSSSSDSSSNSSGSSSSNSSSGSSSNSNSSSSSSEPPPSPSFPDSSTSTPSPVTGSPPSGGVGFLAGFVPPGHQYYGPNVESAAITVGSAETGTKLNANVGALVTTQGNTGYMTIINTETQRSFPVVSFDGLFTMNVSTSSAGPFIAVNIIDIQLLNIEFDIVNGPGSCTYYSASYRSSDQSYPALSNGSGPCR